MAERETRGARISWEASGRRSSVVLPSSDFTAATMWLALMPASSISCSGVAEPGIWCTASLSTRGSVPLGACASVPAKASSTASPRPPSGQWSSTTTSCPPVSCAACVQRLRVDRLDRVGVDHADGDALGLAAASYGLERLVQRDAGARRPSPGRCSDWRTTLLPPIGNCSSGP